MASVHDVAAVILEQCGPMSTMKLQKLVYYSQAWHLVWDEEPLFEETIQAWANGPVVYELFDVHRGSFTVSPPWLYGSPDGLKPNERETIEAVIGSYGHLSGRQLSTLTHAELPWREARGDLPPTARSNREVDPDRMQEFYSALEDDDEARPVDELWSS